jgi:hypothetical protein
VRDEVIIIHYIPPLQRRPALSVAFCNPPTRGAAKAD